MRRQRSGSSEAVSIGGKFNPPSANQDPHYSATPRNGGTGEDAGLVDGSARGHLPGFSIRCVKARPETSRSGGVTCPAPRPAPDFNVACKAHSRRRQSPLRQMGTFVPPDESFGLDQPLNSENHSIWEVNA